LIDTKYWGKYSNSMLTNNDLQAIRKVIKEEVGPLDRKVVTLDKKVEKLDKKLDKAQEDISAILTTVIEHHDALEKRVGHIEEHLNLHPSA